VRDARRRHRAASPCSDGQVEGLSSECRCPAAAESGRPRPRETASDRPASSGSRRRRPSALRQRLGRQPEAVITIVFRAGCLFEPAQDVQAEPSGSSMSVMRRCSEVFQMQQASCTSRTFRCRSPRAAASTRYSVRSGSSSTTSRLKCEAVVMTCVISGIAAIRPGAACRQEIVALLSPSVRKR